MQKNELIRGWAPVVRRVRPLAKTEKARPKARIKYELVKRYVHPATTAKEEKKEGLFSKVTKFLKKW